MEWNWDVGNSYYGIRIRNTEIKNKNKIKQTLCGTKKHTSETKDTVSKDNERTQQAMAE